MACRRGIRVNAPRPRLPPEEGRVVRAARRRAVFKDSSANTRRRSIVAKLPALDNAPRNRRCAPKSGLRYAAATDATTAMIAWHTRMGPRFDTVASAKKKLRQRSAPPATRAARRDTVAAARAFTASTPPTRSAVRRRPPEPVSLALSRALPNTRRCADAMERPIRTPARPRLQECRSSAKVRARRRRKTDPQTATANCASRSLNARK